MSRLGSRVSLWRLVGVFALATLALAAACVAPAVTRLEPPKLSLDAIRVVGASADEVRLALSLYVENPNDREITLDGLDIGLDLSHIKVATATITDRMVLPAHGGVNVDVHATTSPSALSSALAAALNTRTVEYAVAGIARIDGQMLPFVRRGRKNLSDFFDRAP